MLAYLSNYGLAYYAVEVVVCVLNLTTCFLDYDLVRETVLLLFLLPLWLFYVY